MNDLKIFNNEEFGAIRTIEENSKIWFCGKDVAAALGYTNPQKAIKDHCKAPGVTIRSVGVQTGCKTDGNPAIQYVEMKFISEPNLYRLICNSKLPSAERFEEWVFEEVLPTIRQTGRYEIPQERQYTPTRPLTTDDYTEAAKTIAKCHNSRLPIVIDLYRKAGLDIAEINHTEIEQTVEDDLVELLSHYSLKELCELLNLAKSTVYYYQTGKVKPRNKRKQYIIQTLKGTVITE